MKKAVFAILLLLAGCAGEQNSAYNWDDINYLAIACKDRSAAGCKMEEENMATSGRGKGK